jgi:hypothetical protein
MMNKFYENVELKSKICEEIKARDTGIMAFFPQRAKKTKF